MPAKPDFGPCSECGVNNSHAMTRCHKCRALLPWAQPKAAVSAPSASVAKEPKPKIGANWDFGAMSIQLFGGLVFVVGADLLPMDRQRHRLAFPGLGYITMLVGGGLWKAGLSG